MASPSLHEIHLMESEDPGWPGAGLSEVMHREVWSGQDSGYLCIIQTGPVNELLL